MKDYTDISFVQDKSGSMRNLTDATISGFNEFVDGQKKVPGKCLLSLTQFDTEFHIVYNGIEIAKVQPLTTDSYDADGNTALLDAIAMTIRATGKRLAAMPEAERPQNVMIVITTDGEENSSVEFSLKNGGKEKVAEMIKHQTEAYKWNFIFLGANMDAIKVGSSIGTTKGTTMSVAANSKGIAAAYTAMNANTRNYRATSDAGSLMFSTAQRQEQVDAGAVKDALNVTTKTTVD